MPEGVEVVLVRPPGRESRLLEPSFRRLDELIAALRPSLDPLLDVPHSFFGHSMGAFLAFELAHERRRRAKPLPEHLFVSASRAPHVPDDEPPIFSLPDDEFVEKLLARYDGIPLEVRQSPELMELVLPNLKADLELVESYRHRLDAAPLAVPIVALAGTDDTKVPPGQLARWRELTEGSFRLQVIEGGHFFLSSNRTAVLDLLAQELEGWLGSERVHEGGA
jgi:surfactin synthase thioesterase subunit